jgi:transcriptional regulator with XRE-family HTH domain
MNKKEKMIKIGECIKSARTKKHITQIELAVKAGISRPYLSDLENGRYMPSVETISNIAKELEIDLNFLTQMTEIQVIKEVR